jgi:bifunctional non-homologous end joining protein LigD
MRSSRIERVEPRDTRSAYSHSTFVQPMAAHAVDKRPEGDEWMYEVKFDGYRALVLKNGER